MLVMIMGECGRKQSEGGSNEIRDTQPSARSTGLASKKDTFLRIIHPKLLYKNNILLQKNTHNFS